MAKPLDGEPAKQPHGGVERSSSAERVRTMNEEWEPGSGGQAGHFSRRDPSRARPSHSSYACGPSLCRPKLCSPLASAQPRSVLLFLIATFLVPDLWSNSQTGAPGGLHVASAAPCNATVTSFAVSAADSGDLPSMFDCEGGEFNVTWSGSITVEASIQVGAGTSVSIYGDYVNELSSDGDAAGNDTSEVVAGSFYGPIFNVTDASLYLEKLALRDGDTRNFSESQFDVDNSGGGLRLLDGAATIVGCEFENMFAQYWGGGIHANRSRLAVHDTVFRDCSAGEEPGDDEDANGAGGAIGVWSTDLLVHGCLFEDCYASNKGGSIQFPLGNATISDSTFLNSRSGTENEDGDDASGEGGSLSTNDCYNAFDEENGVCLVTGCKFSNSWTGETGGVLRVSTGDYDSQVEVDSCVVTDSSAGASIEDDPQGTGGAFSVGANVTLTILDTVVNRSFAGQKGGAIFLSPGDSDEGYPGGAVVIHNSTFVNCEADTEEGEDGGVIYLDESSIVYIAGHLNSFSDNSCKDSGGVFYGSANSNITIEGGNFTGNLAEEVAGVIYSSGDVTILDGFFDDNKGDTSGGVWVIADDTATMTVKGGVFTNNDGGRKGGVGTIEEATLYVLGGSFSSNDGEDGGVFYVDEDSHVEITGGEFANNTAEFGGFMYKTGEGTTTCTGASIQGHEAVDGAGIYAAEDVLLDGWECDLIGNSALSGPAIYARDESNISLRGVTVSDNTVSRGSVVFLASSFLYTIDTVFHDPKGLTDITAIQADEESVFVAENTSFVGFVGESVIYSEGELILDGCDFSGSSSDMLVEGYGDKTLVRNAILGDTNYESQAAEASESNDFPSVSFILDHETCSDTPCSNGSFCVDGKLGVYCEAYVGSVSFEEVHVTTNPDVLGLEVASPPVKTFYPELIEGVLNLSFMWDSYSSGASSTDTTSDGNWSDDGDKANVVWEASARSYSTSDIAWVIFPSNGLLMPGASISLHIISNASHDWEGNVTVHFSVNPPVSAYDNGSVSVTSSTTPAETAAVLQAASSQSLSWSASRTVELEVEYYHCDSGEYWVANDEECDICAEASDIGEEEGLDCSEPGASTVNPPLSDGYWRASVDELVIRECPYEDACIGGRSENSSDDYCDEGYRGPLCAICEDNWGRGVSYSCHECTDALTGGMYFLVALGCLIMLVIVILLAIYLVGGKDAVRDSVIEMRRRGSSLLGASGSGTSRVPKEKGQSATVLPWSGDEEATPRAGFGIQGLMGFRSSPGASGPRRRIIRRDKRSLNQGVDDFRDAIVSNVGEAKSPDRGRFAQQHAVSDMTGSASNWEIFNPQEVSKRGPRSRAHVSGSGRTSPLDDSRLTKVHEARQGEVKLPDDRESAGKRAVFPRPPFSGEAASDSAFNPRGEAKDGLGDSGVTAGPPTGDGGVVPGSAIPADKQGGDHLPGVRDDELYRTGQVSMTSVRGSMPAGSQGEPVTQGRVGRSSKLGGSRIRRSGRGRERKSTASRIGDFLAKLPLSQLKIIVVVWQINSAFSEVTQVSFPSTYETYLETISLFSFDLGWILSAACLTMGMTFYSKLLIITIGPLVLLCLLGVTFYLGTRRALSGQSQRDSLGSDGSESARVSSRGFGDASVDMSRTEVMRGSDRGSGETQPGVNVPEPGQPGQPSPAPGSGGSEGRSGLAAAICVNDRSQRSLRDILRSGPGGERDMEQNQLWNLFARHTTMTLIILYLVYSQVSTVVFQTFGCEDFDELGKSYLWADFRIECYTPEHNAYMAYAGVMVFVYPIGIPLAFWYFLNRHSSRINPEVDMDSRHAKDDRFVRDEKMNVRKEDKTIAPTAFLWAAYYPSCYFYEVFECVRRLLLTGLLVFIPGSTAQVAIACVFAFVSLVAFELLRPHADDLDLQLYRTGCLVIFFSNFLALLLEADILETDDSGSAAFSVALVIVHVLFFLSIWWNAYVSVRVMFSRSHVQDTLFGVDLVPEKELEQMMPPEQKGSKRGIGFNLFKRGGRKSAGEASRGPDAEPDDEDGEAGPAWETESSRPMAQEVPHFGTLTIVTTPRPTAEASADPGLATATPQTRSDVQSYQSRLPAMLRLKEVKAEPVGPRHRIVDPALAPTSSVDSGSGASHGSNARGSESSSTFTSSEGGRS